MPQARHSSIGPQDPRAPCACGLQLWDQAVEDGLVDMRRRRDYDFPLQRRKTIYEASQ
jgi:hypothetical protein